MNNTKYIAIKVKGIAHWLWFDTKKVKLDGTTFVGNEGWGKDGALTSINVLKEEIIGKLYSDNLQYT